VDFLPPALVARMSAKRGRSHAFDDLNPAATALVVIDMTAMFVTGRSEAAAVTVAINRIARQLRRRGGLVQWVVPVPFQHAQLLAAVIGPDAAGRHQAAAEGRDFEARLWPDLDVQAGDQHARKSLYSAFFPGSSDSAEQLARLGIDTVIIAGALTDVCCDASARDAFSLGFRVIMVADACIGSSEDAHANALASIFRNFGDVRSSDEILELLSASARAPTR
jgi:nicotinamidase-related amidase